MAHRYIIDTHVLVWFVEGNKQLSEPAKAILAATNSQIVLPLIALAEAALIIEHRRTTIPLVM
jgi:PIN domain nuclease of toxin-antitoxin system